MSSLPWNSPGATTCHCSDCDAKPEPACVVCRADDVPLNDDGLCAMCCPGEDEICEDYAARMRRIRSARLGPARFGLAGRGKGSNGTTKGR